MREIIELIPMFWSIITKNNTFDMLSYGFRGTEVHNNIEYWFFDDGMGEFNDSADVGGEGNPNQPSREVDRIDDDLFEYWTTDKCIKDPRDKKMTEKQFWRYMSLNTSWQISVPLAAALGRYNREKPYSLAFEGKPIKKVCAGLGYPVGYVSPVMVCMETEGRRKSKPVTSWYCTPHQQYTTLHVVVTFQTEDDKYYSLDLAGAEFPSNIPRMATSVPYTVQELKINDERSFGSVEAKELKNPGTLPRNIPNRLYVGNMMFYGGAGFNDYLSFSCFPPSETYLDTMCGIGKERWSDKTQLDSKLLNRPSTMLKSLSVLLYIGLGA
jgi:hypothetical protein